MRQSEYTVCWLLLRELKSVVDERSVCLPLRRARINRIVADINTVIMQSAKLDPRNMDETAKKVR